MHFSKQSLLTLAILFMAALLLAPTSGSAAQPEMLDLDLASLMQIQITSAGRKAQNLDDVPAAVYVIDQEDLHSSGVTSIPEALRMAPGLQVARISSSKWAITARGFNGTFANKLLVQIDGRSVYTPAYSGVYWDVQNVLLEDVERIEVIRGPGATLWGANAVNGVINIITKHAEETQGGLLSVGAGNHEDGMLSFRYGAPLTPDVYGRWYLSRHDQDAYVFAADQTDANDDWEMTNGGVRLDGDVGLSDAWTLQGDLYHGQNKQRVDTLWIPTPPYLTQVYDQTQTRGYNLLARWQHNNSESDNWTAQIFYDYTNRDEIYLEQTNRTLDIDLQQRYKIADTHDIVWGLGYRLNRDDFGNTYQVQLTPDSQTSNLFSAFIQDEIPLQAEKLWLTLGTKFEHNAYTGVEVQPNLRLLWRPAEHHNLWTAVARAVRTPSRVEDSGRIVTAVIPPSPPFTTTVTELSIAGTSDFDSEILLAYEAGYRYSPQESLSFDLALFYNDYSAMQSYAQASPFEPISFANRMEGETYGLEIATTWVPKSWLKADLNYSYIKVLMDDPSNLSFSVDRAAEGSSPRHQLSLRTRLRLARNLHLNLWGRYTDSLAAASLTALRNNISVDEYFNLDANLSWELTEDLELTIAGQNLLDNRHLEFVAESLTSPIEIERSLYAKLTWKY